MLTIGDLGGIERAPRVSIYELHRLLTTPILRDLVAPLVKQGGLDLRTCITPLNLHPNHADYIANTLFIDFF